MEAAEAAVRMAQSGKKTVPQHTFSDRVEKALAEIREIAGNSIPEENSRWYCVKLFERDEKLKEQISLSSDKASKIEGIIAACETELDDDSESIITNERYEYIARVIKDCVHKKRTGYDNLGPH